MAEDVKDCSTFCVLPWIHLSTKSDGSLRQCNRAANYIPKDQSEVYNLNSHRVSEVWNSPYLKEVRRHMLAGRKPEACKECWQDEDHYGRISRRQSENDLWQTRIDFEKLQEKTRADGSYDEEPIYWDLRLGNLCNLKCVMCNPVNSSKWSSEKTMLNRYQNLDWNEAWRAKFNWPKLPEVWKSLEGNIENLQEIYFAGGEPTLHREHHQFLNKLVERGISSRIHLRYDTNGTQVDKELIELWLKFKTINIQFSIDGLGDILEYIRYPIVSDKLIAKLQLLKDLKLPHLRVIPQFSLSVLNVFHFPDFTRWWFSSGLSTLCKPDQIFGSLAPVNEPHFLSPRVLTPEQKDEVKRAYEKLQKDLIESGAVREDGFNKFESMVRYILEEDWSHLKPTLMSYLSELDSLRGTDSKKVFRWLYEHQEPALSITSTVGTRDKVLES